VPRQHWFSRALKGASRPLPIIPTAALDHAFGGILPAAPLARAIASNDAETAIQLGALCLLEDDLALADFVTAASPRLSSMLRALIDRIAREEGA
jgi:Na+-transporting NADH:ubiquinone oxidoreductase subunit A